jgi:hypothetical protein
MGTRAGRVIIYGAVAVLALAFGATAATSAANVCTTTGATPAVAAKALGHGARASEAVVTGRQACVLSSAGGTSGPSVTILLVKGQLGNLVQSEMYQGPVHSQGVTGLGTGAVFLSTSDHTFQHLWFQGGSYAVKVTSDGTAHAAPAVLITVARAVYAHLG